MKQIQQLLHRMMKLIEQKNTMDFQYTRLELKDNSLYDKLPWGVAENTVNPICFLPLFQCGNRYFQPKVCFLGFALLTPCK